MSGTPDQPSERWIIDFGARTIKGPPGVLRLTSTEFKLIAHFASHPQIPISRQALAVALHGKQHASGDRSIDILVCRVRRKMEPGEKYPQIIKTIRNEGYYFTLSPAKMSLEAAANKASP